MATPARQVKVVRFEILKPVGGMTWDELGELLRDVRYRVFRLGNLAVSEAYLAFHLFRTGQSDKFKTNKIGDLSKRLREMLKEEKVKDKDLDRIARNHATPSSIHDAFFYYKIKALTTKSLTTKSPWSDALKGKRALPTFRADVAIPIRCDKNNDRRLERTEADDVEVDLRICVQPYPRVMLKTGKLDGSAKAILDHLLKNQTQDLEGYRQRLFEVKQNNRDKKWWLHVTYDFPATTDHTPRRDIVVGVDVGYSCPLTAAISNGHARLGWRRFRALGHRIKALKLRTMARRREIQRGGAAVISGETARSGHGRQRKLAPIGPLEGRIGDAYTTLNHQLSTAVIKFARDHNAGIIQMEDLTDLKDRLKGTFLGIQWRYHQLQTFLEYKAKEQGLEIQKVPPCYTSRRCSDCGWINVEFDRAARDRASTPGRVAKFKCPKCEFEADPDYNAARNLAVLDIGQVIKQQCAEQGLKPVSTDEPQEAL